MGHLDTPVRYLHWGSLKRTEGAIGAVLHETRPAKPPVENIKGGCYLGAIFGSLVLNQMRNATRRTTLVNMAVSKLNRWVGASLGP